MQLLESSKIHVAVLAGGSSSEREVSLSSGAQVHQALDAAGFPNELIDTKDIKTASNRLMDGSFDVVFIALHGKGGEDGSVQGMCEMIGLPYTGSGILASAMAMDKWQAKLVYANNGIPTAPSVRLSCGDTYDVSDIAAAVGEKCVVKPAADGSSVGLSIVHGIDELPAAIDKVFDLGEDALIESYIDGIEVTVAVIGNDNPEVLPVVEIVPHAEFYDYEVKYAVNGAEHVIPARLDVDKYALVQEYALAAHRALGCRGMSRSDFLIDPQKGPFILETNTIPGMTETSLLPDAARHAGYDFPTLCSMIVGFALEGR